MTITPEQIDAYEEKYNVDIEVVECAPGENQYRVTTLPELNEPMYVVEVTALNEGPLTISPETAATFGIPHTGDINTDMGSLNRSMFNSHGEATENFDENFPNFAETGLHRAAIVGAWLRTNGEITPETWAEDRSFGAAGAGPEILPFVGGNGGMLSRIGIAHDADWALGAASAQGPMRALNEVVLGNDAVPGEIPTGLHGIPWANSGLELKDAATFGLGTSDNDQNMMDTYDRQRENFPNTEDIPGYELDQPDWDTDIRTPRRILGMDTVRMHGYDTSEEATCAATEQIEAGLDLKIIQQAFEATEHPLFTSDNTAELAHSNAMAAHESESHDYGLG